MSNNKVTFASLKLKMDESVKIIKVMDHEVEVKQAIPVSDKNDLVQIALQKSEENGIYNEIMFDMYFHLNLVYLYTNIVFTDKQREDEAKLYDILQSNHVIEQVISAMAENEYTDLLQYANDMQAAMLRYRNTAGAVLQSIIQDLPKNAAAAKEIVDSFDKTKFQSVIDFATAANGGRNIHTNQPVAVVAAE